ncbi:HNH endonuclease signature motif containing protein [Rathayibacter sp. Leaf248]|uniref:HNH endonuclease signature motif containing protein n=1 Tax=Rathayibacter sp. Leaf248 TaxID=2876555 RepID=UPI001E41A334|nr:HNH endonuclease signature motif containing protein [Rathayibacter sp. Leaf248]
MTSDGETPAHEALLGEVRDRGDRAAELARAASPILLASAEELYAGYRTAMAQPESFARGLADPGSGDLAARSVRAELAVALGISERAVARELDHAAILIEDLPLTRAALAAARMRWEAGQIVCAIAATLPVGSRPAFDEQAADLAVAITPTQLRRALARLREELHPEPLTKRHARAREDRAVWIAPEADGMAMLCAHLPATAALGMYSRLDRIARTLRDGADPDGAPGDQRTLAQLRADALTDLVCDGDLVGTIPRTDLESREAAYVPGIRAHVRLTLTASTALGLDDAPVELDGYGPVPADSARALLVSTLTRVVTEPDTGVVLSVGRTHRLPPERMRLFVQLRDETCRFPGCTRPASSAEADHTVEWRFGGETGPHNLASLCTAHHHVRHGDRWTYVLHPDGTTDWTTPTGRRVITRPPGLRPTPDAPRVPSDDSAGAGQDPPAL